MAEQNFLEIKERKREEPVKSQEKKHTWEEIQTP